MPPLRICLLSGGESRRMGRDKALLPHPEGGSWLEGTLRLLITLEAPITLLSRHNSHLQLARQLAPAAAALRISPVAEPPPWEGPLLALQRLSQAHPEQRLLLCPVDMPWLTRSCLQTLLAAADADPGLIHLAHDGVRRQPLLGIYPSLSPIREDLERAVADGERRLQGWLAGQRCREVRLDPQALRNLNHHRDLPGAGITAAADPVRHDRGTPPAAALTE